jgi:hypothetical protein
MQKGFAFTRLADRLTSIAELSDGDLELLTRMSYTIGHFTSHECVLRKGDEPSSCCLLLQGYLCWKDPASGQITSIYVPGDVPDLHTVTAPQLDAHLTALGPRLLPRHFVAVGESWSCRSAPGHGGNSLIAKLDRQPGQQRFARPRGSSDL